MSDDAATEWLAVAAGEVANLRPYAFRTGCSEARKTCSHHGQIIPTILKAADDPHEREIRRLQRDGHSFPDRPQLTQDNDATRLIQHTARSLQA